MGCVLAALACDTGQAAEPTGMGGSAGLPQAGGTGQAGVSGQGQGGDAANGGTSTNGGSPSTVGGNAGQPGGTAGTAGSVGSDAGNGEPPGMDAPARLIEYTADTSEFSNPERGFYSYALLTDGPFDYVREAGKTLVYTNMELQDYLGDNHEQELPAALLSAVQDGFDAVRSARLKAIVRFRYDSGAGYP
ncbi:MAG TPA: DUF4874 domain-containing protein, partial [Polyangiaceae bacterium]|nr:DUF4874 domain-containing protein [Polyangiaceae bacterium]